LIINFWRGGWTCFGLRAVLLLFIAFALVLIIIVVVAVVWIAVEVVEIASFSRVVAELEEGRGDEVVTSGQFFFVSPPLGFDFGGEVVVVLFTVFDCSSFLTA
jgi:hypothetical protein